MMVPNLEPAHLAEIVVEGASQGPYRAGLFNHLGRTSDALNCVRSAEELGGPSATSAWFYSIIYDAAGDLDDAISSARRACEARRALPLQAHEWTGSPAFRI